MKDNSVNSLAVKVTDGTGVFSDTVTLIRVVDGANGQNAPNPITGYLTNESLTLAATSTGVISGLPTVVSSFKVLDGTTEVVATTPTYALVQGSLVGCNASINSSGDISLLSLTDDQGSAQFAATYGGQTIKKVINFAKSKQGVQGNPGTPGAPGTPARIINLTSTSQVLKAPPGGGATTPASTTVSATVLNTGTLSWTYSVDGVTFSSTKPAYVSTPSGNSVVVTGSTMTASTVTIKVSDGVVSDTYTIAKVQDGTNGQDGIPGSVGPKGEDAYTVILSNEAHAFAGDISNALAGSTYFDIIAYKGATRILSTVGTITGTKTGISADITNNGSTTARVTVTVTTGLTSGGILTIPITVDGKVFTKQFVYTISFKGQPGQQGPAGRSITSVDVWYYLSTSSTSLAGGVWDTTAPAWVNGRYMWSKTVTTYSTGDPTESTPVCITGAKGSTGGTGATGRGVSSIVEEFYLSTSKTTQTGSSWKTTPDPWSPGKYMWTRSKITYTSGTPTTDTTTPLVSSEWEAVNEIQVGGRNLLVSDTLNRLSETMTEKTTKKLKGSGAYYFDFGTNFKPNTEYTVSNSNILNDSALYPNSIRLDLYNVLGASLRLGIGTMTSGSSVTFKTPSTTAETDRLYFYVSSTAIVNFEIDELKLEKGNKATDWTAAPEDTNEFINEVANGISDLDTQLRQYTNDNIGQLQADVEDALGTKELAWHYAGSAPTIPMPGMVWVDTSKTLYVPKRYNATAAVWEPLVPQTAADVGAYPDNLGQTLASSFADFEANFNEGVYIQSVIDSQLFVEALAGKADASYATEFSQSVEEFNLAISTLQTDSTEHGATVKDIKDNFKFSADGLNISKSTSPFNVNITNSQLSFRNGEEDLAWLDGNTMYISQIKVESKNPDIKPQLIVGVHSITKHDADTTIVRWVG